LTFFRRHFLTKDDFFSNFNKIVEEEIEASEGKEIEDLSPDRVKLVQVNLILAA
jgi:hypothetical protein